MNYDEKNVYVYNEYWDYQRTIKIANNPSYSLNLNGVIYVAANDVINKYDKYLNLTKQVSFSGANRGIYYNPLNQLIFVTNINNNITNVFDKDLNLNSSFKTISNPFFITGYNEMLVITDGSGKVYIYQNNSIIQNVTTQCTSRVTSILFDNYSHMLLLCELSSYLYVYHLNGSYTGLSMSTCVTGFKRLYANFDSKDRLVITCYNQTEIYY